MQNGWLSQARQIISPNFDARPADELPSLLVIHHISLPPQVYTGEGIIQLFTNQLPIDAHPYYAHIAHLRVSAHFLIRRDGELIQFVSCLDRAWHAGASSWQGRERCNDFSIGIELEGSDFDAFTAVQYSVLHELTLILLACYPIRSLAGHSDISPNRKTDPGVFFDWQRYQFGLARPDLLFPL